MSISQPAKLLVVLYGAIGDVTRALPLVSRIKKNWPETAIHWAVEPASAGILESFEYVDKVFVFRRKEGLKAYIELVKAVSYTHLTLPTKA